MTGDARTGELRDGLRVVRSRIDDACHHAGRPTSEVSLIVVTKYFPSADVLRLHDLGVRDVGENRDQEASRKVGELPDPVRADLTVHFIGQLQSNKARHVAAYADVVHSLDRTKLVRALDRAALEHERTLDVLVQVDLSGGDAGRGGSEPGQVSRLADQVEEARGLRLRGLMAVAPLGAPARPAFEHLADLADRIRADHPAATWMSAGMSGDLEDAVMCGATHLRVGSAILGSRPARR